MECPNCGAVQPPELADSGECFSCGIIFARFKKQRGPKQATGTLYSQDRRDDISWLERLLDGHDHLFIEQHARHWYEILLNWEQANEYMIRDSRRSNIGVIDERTSGFFQALLRVFLGSHRPLDVRVHHFQSDQLAMTLKRDFFFLFSEMEVGTPDGRHMGKVQRRFGMIYKKYDLIDRDGRVFAQIASPLWRLWRFPIFDQNGEQVAEITKRWSGMLKEMYTDADNFTVDFGKRKWTLAQKAVIFAAAISIDFDFFENNHQ